MVRRQPPSTTNEIRLNKGNKRPLGLIPSTIILAADFSFFYLEDGIGGSKALLI